MAQISSTSTPSARHCVWYNPFYWVRYAVTHALVTALIWTAGLISMVITRIVVGRPLQPSGTSPSTTAAVSSDWTGSSNRSRPQPMSARDTEDAASSLKRATLRAPRRVKYRTWETEHSRAKTGGNPEIIAYVDDAVSTPHLFWRLCRLRYGRNYDRSTRQGIFDALVARRLTAFETTVCLAAIGLQWTGLHWGVENMPPERGRRWPTSNTLRSTFWPQRDFFVRYRYRPSVYSLKHTIFLDDGELSAAFDASGHLIQLVDISPPFRRFL